MQGPFDVAVMAEIIKLARAGGVAGAGVSFDTIVYVGHSYGSVILNGLIAAEPQLVDAAVFTGVCGFSVCPSHTT